MQDKDEESKDGFGHPAEDKPQTADNDNMAARQGGGKKNRKRNKGEKVVEVQAIRGGFF